MIPVHFPDDPFVDTEALAAEKQFRDAIGTRGYTQWARQVRLQWEATSEHAKAMRARQRREGNK